jgi:hypothetical protein
MQARDLLVIIEQSWVEYYPPNSIPLPTPKVKWKELKVNTSGNVQNMEIKISHTKKNHISQAVVEQMRYGHQ